MSLFREISGDDPNTPLTAEMWNAAVRILRVFENMSDDALQGALHAMGQQRHSGDHYSFECRAQEDDDVPHFAVFGVCSEANSKKTNGIAEIFSVAKIATDFGHSPLILLTCGENGIKAGELGRGHAFNQREPAWVLANDDLSTFNVGYPCGPRADGSWGIVAGMPGFVCLGTIPKDTSSGLQRADDLVVVMRTSDASFIGRMTTNADMRSDSGSSGTTPGTGKAKIQWLDYSNMSSPAMVDAMDPSDVSGSEDIFEIPVLNFSASAGLSTDDLVAIVPVIGVGFVATLLC